MIETINFKKFMENDWRKEERKHGFVPFPVASMFLNEPVMIIFGAGLVIVGLAIYERVLVSKGREYDAEMVSMLTGVALPTIGIGGAMYVIMKAWRVFL